MSKKKLHIAFVLDETGSMEPFKQKTVSGFNEYIETLKKDHGKKDVRFTLTLFNSKKTEIRYDNTPLKDVRRLGSDQYLPDYLTPLYDAIGKTIMSYKKKDKVLVVIMTDGEENASREYNREMIFKMIEERRKAGWAFVFLGANQDAYIAGGAIGVDKGNTYTYDQGQTLGAFRGTAMASANYLASGGGKVTNLVEDVDEEIWKET